MVLCWLAPPKKNRENVEISMFSCFFAIFDLKIRMQYFQYFQGLKIELIIPFVLKLY